MTPDENRAPISDLLAEPPLTFRARRGTLLRARSWRTEGLLRMFENALEVAERPEDLIVYAGLGKAARDWPSARRIAMELLDLHVNETLVLQSGAPVGVIRTRKGAPMVISAVNNTVGNWATTEKFWEREAAGDTIWGGLTAAAWQYIGRQGVLQGTYELIRAIAARHFDGQVEGRWMLTAGAGGMGSAQPISGRMLGLSTLLVEVDRAKLLRLAAVGGLDVVLDDAASALRAVSAAVADRRVIAVGLVGNAADVFTGYAERSDVVPDIVTDQTAAHDARVGYLPSGYDLAQWTSAAAADPQRVERDARASMSRQFDAMLEFQRRGSIAVENGNNLRVQVVAHRGEAHSETIYAVPGFMEYLRPLFSRGIGPFRWVALSGEENDLALLDELVIDMFPDRPELAAWINAAREGVPAQGLPARSCWLGHGERSAFAAVVNELVADGTLTAPVLFSRDHLDSASMTHPRIGTEGMLDGSDGVTDWPILDSLLLAATGADLVAVHSGGGGYSGWMQSAGVSIVADGRKSTTKRLIKVLDADTALGVLRHAKAGYSAALNSIAAGGETGSAALHPLFDLIDGEATP